jgi:anti-sigma B factor antagonist
VIDVRVQKDVVGSVAIITLSGDLDAGAGELAGDRAPGLMPAHDRVLLDLSQVSHLTAAGLRTLLLLYRQGQCLDTSVALVGLTAELRNALAASGFLHFFQVADSVADGLELLAPGAADLREPVDA